MKDILDYIIKAEDNAIIHIYPRYTKTTYTIKPTMYTENEADKIIEKIKKISTKESSIEQTEYFYRDLVRLTFTDNGSERNIMNYKKSLAYHEIEYKKNNIVMIKNIIIYIPNNDIPVLSCYNNTEKKNIIIYEMTTIDILVISFGDKKQFCINVKKFPQTALDILKKELEISLALF